MVDQKLPPVQPDSALAAMRQAPGRPPLDLSGNGRSIAAEPKESPIATILDEWMTGTFEHYRREEREVTRRWATAMLDIDRRRSAYYQQMLGPLVK